MNSTVNGSTSRKGIEAFGAAWSGWLRYGWHFMGRYLDLDSLQPVNCEAEKDLYGSPPKYTGLYRRGRRPLLERLLSDLAMIEPALREGADSEMEAALALLDWTYWEVHRRGSVIETHAPDSRLLEGGAEEETVALVGRTGTFECSRVLATLLQMRRIPARICLLFGKPYEARAAVEAYLERNWALLDVAVDGYYAAGKGESAPLACMEFLDGNAALCSGDPRLKRRKRPAPLVLQAGICDYPVREAREAW